MRYLLVAAALTVTSALVACSPATSRPGETTLTSADYTGMGTDIPSTREEETTSAAPGQLVCKTSSKTDGAVELRLDWKGTTAAGTLRRVAPSGATSEQRVTAEQFEGKIVADDVWSKDVAVHAAVVRTVNGKKQISLGDSAAQGWLACD